MAPLIQGFEDAGDFTVTERLKTSIHVNLVFYLIVGSIGLFGLILLIIMHKNWFHSHPPNPFYFVFPSDGSYCLPFPLCFYLQRTTKS